MAERAVSLGKAAAVSVVCAGLTASVVAWALAPSGEGQAREARAVGASGEAAETAEAMGARVERLSARVEALEGEVARLEELRRLDREGVKRTGGELGGARAAASARGGAGGAGAAVGSGKVEAEVARLLDEGASPVRERVGEIIRDEMDIAREERFLKRKEQRAERVKERVAEFAEANGLSDAQHEAMAKLLVDERVKMMELRRKAREEGGGWDGMRDRARALREENAQALAEILSAEQLKAYQEQRERSRRERGGGGGRGR